MTCDRTITWIPVTERLPDANKWYLAVVRVDPGQCRVVLIPFCDSGEIINGSFFHDGIWEYYANYCGPTPGSLVSHWADVPAPPDDCVNPETYSRFAAAEEEEKVAPVITCGDGRTTIQWNRRTPAVTGEDENQ